MSCSFGDFNVYGSRLSNNIRLSPSRRREAPCEGTNSPRLFTPGETKALAKSKVHQLARASVTNDGWSSSLISKIWRTVMNNEH
jgi:hypothetical protein